MPARMSGMDVPSGPSTLKVNKMARKKEVKKTKNASPISHDLIPIHEKCTEKEKKELFKKYHIIHQELPKIHMSDPAIRHLEVKPGDIIKIKRKDPKAGISIYYRVVINE